MSSFKLSDTKGDDWDDLAAEYKKFSTGPATAATASLLQAVNATLPFSRATAILDNGCGPAPITSRIIEQHGAEIPEACKFLAADFSEGMIKQADATKAEQIAAGNPIWPRVETKVLDAMDLQDVQTGSQSHVLAGWVYFMTPDPQKCLAESLRVLQDDGVMACTAWEGSQWLELMNTLSEVRPDKKLPSLPEAWSDVGLLKGELEKAGFRDVMSERVPVTMPFERHEVLVDWLVTKLPHAVALTKDMSAEEVERYKQVATAKCREFCPEAPGELHGWSLMAVGRK